MTQSSFSDLGLSEAVLGAVDDLGYAEPTPVQAQAIPEVLAGRDLLAAAQTGTGKTAAFLLPAMSRLGHAARHHGPSMLVVTPTRELAQQIEDVCTTIEARTHHRSVTVVGGVGYEPQKAALHRGCDILVATPGRLVDLIDQGEAKLGEVELLVLDEADRMLDMGFLPAMRKIVGATPSTRQTLLFSATLDESAIGGIRDLVHDPAVVEIAHKGTVAETIDQYVLPVSLEAKNALLGAVLKAEGPSRVIVFTRTKHRADACCRRLRRAGISCAPIHGNRSQSQRGRALASFRSGEVDVLVATDVLARGIDVSDVRYVVNFDVPEDPEDYIHRIGRTGRAGETGWALTFVTVNDRADLFACERLMGQVVPEYARAGEFELGEEPPALDPGRSAEKPARGGAPGKKRTRARGGRKRAAGQAGTASVAAAAKSRSESRTGSQSGGKPAGRKAKKAPEREPEAALLSEKELAAVARSKGGRGGQPASNEPRRRRNSRSNTGAKGRADAPGREQRKAPQKQGRAGGEGGSPKGERRASVQASGQPSTNSAGKKGRRRVGDRQGRARGIY